MKKKKNTTRKENKKKKRMRKKKKEDGEEEHEEEKEDTKAYENTIYWTFFKHPHIKTKNRRRILHLSIHVDVLYLYHFREI